jgi:hypothetical protein
VASQDCLSWPFCSGRVSGWSVLDSLAREMLVSNSGSDVEVPGCCDSCLGPEEQQKEGCGVQQTLLLLARGESRGVGRVMRNDLLLSGTDKKLF